MQGQTPSRRLPDQSEKSVHAKNILAECLRFGIVTLSNEHIRKRRFKQQLTQLLEQRQSPIRVLHLKIENHETIAAFNVALFPWVETLVVDFPRIERWHLAEIARLSQLRALILRCAGLDDEIASPIAELKQLKHLAIKNAKDFTAKGLEHLEQLRQLQSLDLQNCSINLHNANAKYLTGLTLLEKLNLQGTGVCGEVTRHISGLTKLRELNLSYTEISNQSLAHLGSLRQLRYLGLAGNTHITDAGIAHLQQLRRLQVIDLCNTPRVGDACRQYLPKKIQILSDDFIDQHLISAWAEIN